MKFIEIHTSVGNLEEAKTICQKLVAEKLAACCHIIPKILSVYSWKNKIEYDQECKIIIKTRQDYFDEIKELILANHSYDLPEIICLSITGGYDKYLQWLKECLRG